MAGTFKEAFRRAGFALTNPRSQWSAVSEDGTRVAVTVWSDRIDKSADPWVYNVTADPMLEEWKERQGNRTRIGHLLHSLEHCGGRCVLILCKAVDPNASPRKVDWARPWPERQGILKPDSLNRETGEFIMELLPAA